ncbi:MAG: hypothetical protein AB7P08_17245 [Burkholderiales bacterium]
MSRRLHAAALWIVAAIALAILVTACGGGGPSAAGRIVPAPELRRDLLFGYYGGRLDTVLENGDHVNLHWATGWEGRSGAWHLDVATELAHARGAGVRHAVLALPHGLVWEPNAADEVRFQLVRLQQAGALEGWESIWLYPSDEPEIPENGAHGDAEVTAMVSWLRGVMRGFPALEGAPVGVFYACASGARPGIGAFDLVGCNDYDARCDVFFRHYPALEARMRPEQRLMVIAGGASPWRQDPACFEVYSHGNKRVAALLGFIWQDRAAPGVGAGIRSNGLRKLYCEAGRRISAREGAC